MSQYLTFAVDDEAYGIGIVQAKEIIEYDGMTSVPNAPAWIRGVINLRGTVVPVVDLAVKFGRRPREIHRRTCIVVVEVAEDGGQLVMGILADRVIEVVELAGDAVEPPPSFGTGVRTTWLQGLGRVGSGFVLLLDLDRVLTDAEVGDIHSVEESCEVTQ